jgi:hypothetical protein
MVKSTERLPAGVVRRLKGRPYYAYLYARNVLGGRLPASLEMDLVSDPQSAYLYAREVVGGRLPDSVHAGLVMGSFESRDGNGWVGLYLYFVGGK